MISIGKKLTFLVHLSRKFFPKRDIPVVERSQFCHFCNCRNKYCRTSHLYSYYVAIYKSVLDSKQMTAYFVYTTLQFFFTNPFRIKILTSIYPFSAPWTFIWTKIFVKKSFFLDQCVVWMTHEWHFVEWHIVEDVI